MADGRLTSVLRPHLVPDEHDEYAADTPREACGVFGVFAPGQPVAHLTYLGLYALQHRGQESAGMAVSDGEVLTVVKEMGLVSNVFDDRTLTALSGDLAIGHTRYSTTGSSTWRNAQPVYRGVDHVEFALGHNGNLVNTEALTAEAGMLPGTVTSDTDLMAELLTTSLLARPDLEPGTAFEAALSDVLPGSTVPSRSCSPIVSASSACAIPTGSGHCAWAASTGAGCSPPSHLPST